MVETSQPRCLVGLDSLLEKDWRGQGFDQEVDQLVKFIQSDKSTRCSSQVCLHLSLLHLSPVWSKNFGIRMFNSFH